MRQQSTRTSDAVASRMLDRPSRSRHPDPGDVDVGDRREVPSTLGDLLDAQRAALFVGRHEELETLASILHPESDARVGYIEGPGGMGKTELARAVSRRALQQGIAVRWLDAAVVSSSKELEAVLSRCGHSACVELVVLDAVDTLGVELAWLQTDAIPRLPSSVRVLLTTRERPPLEWRTSGWATLCQHVSLGLFTPEECRSYLGRRKVPAARALA